MIVGCLSEELDGNYGPLGLKCTGGKQRLKNNTRKVCISIAGHTPDVFHN